MTQIVIQQNASLTTSAACCFIAVISILLLSIAAGFAYQGLWLVAPFAGLEVVLLITVFWHLLSSSRRKQLISVDFDMVRVEVGIDRAEYACDFKRAWVQVVLESSKIRGYPSKLFLRSSGSQVRIGEVLNENERVLLARRLKRLVTEYPKSRSIIDYKYKG